MIDHEADHACAVENNWKRSGDCLSVYMLDTEHNRYQCDKHRDIIFGTGITPTKKPIDKPIALSKLKLRDAPIISVLLQA